MAYVKNGYHKNGRSAVSGLWGDTKDFASNIAGTVSNVRTITGNVAKEGKLKVETQLPPYVKYALFAALGLGAYYIFTRKR